MTCKFVEGKKIAESIYSSIRSGLKEKSLLIVVNKKDKIIQKFVQKKLEIAKKLDIKAEVKENYTQNPQALIEFIKKYQKTFDGVILQLPLNKSIAKEEVLSFIDTKKDVDVLNPDNKRLFYQGKFHLVPPVACAVSEILNFYDINVVDKRIAIIGYGELVGKPVEYVLKNQGAQTYVLLETTPEHTRKQILKESEIIVSGAGVPNLITKKDIKENAILIDAGTSSSKLSVVGDIDLNCCSKSKIFAKTPGGVGPVTVACLFKNLYLLAN